MFGPWHQSLSPALPPPLAPDWSLLDLLRRSPAASADALLQPYAVRAQLRRLDARDTRAQTESWWRNSVRRLSPSGLSTHVHLLVDEGRKRVTRTIDSAALLALVIVCEETRGVLM